MERKSKIEAKYGNLCREGKNYALCQTVVKKELVINSN